MKIMQRISAFSLCLVMIISALIIAPPLKAEAVNPYLPLWEHLPDGEPRLFEDPDNPGKYRAYIYGSHDTRFGSYCGPDIRVWSAPVEDLTNWRDDGPCFTYYISDQWDVMYAPDIAEIVQKDGSKVYYLYPHSRGNGRVSLVAKGYRPDGPFTAINANEAGTGVLPGSILGFDPSVYIEYVTDPTDPDYDIGYRAYGYWGYAGSSEKSWACELDQNTMYSVRPGTQAHQYFMPCSSSYGNLNDPAGTEYKFLYPDQDPKAFNFFEASSLRKVGNKYVMLFSGYSGPDYGLGSTNSALRYCFGDSPMGPWRSGGVLVDSRAPVLNEEGTALATSYSGHNTHGSLLEINNQWYVYYHRAPRGFGYARQPMVAPMKITWDEKSVAEGGKVVIKAYDPYSEDNTWTAKAGDNEYTGAEVTSEGFEIFGLDPYKYYSAGIACYLSSTGTQQDSWDIWDNNMPITGVSNGHRIGYKYFGFGGLASDQKGLKAFEGTKPGNETKLNLFLTPRTVGEFTVSVWLDGPWANDAWKGTKIGEITVPANSEQALTKFTVDVSQFVDNLDKKHAIFLVASGGSGLLFDLTGLGFSSKDTELAMPEAPTVSVLADGVPLTLPAAPTRSTNANGILNYENYDVTYKLPFGTTIMPVITASSSDSSIKISVAQSSSVNEPAVVRFNRNGVLKTYTVIFSEGVSLAAQTITPAKNGTAYPGGASGDVIDLPLELPAGDWTLTATVTASPRLIGNNGFADQNSRVGIAICDKTNPAVNNMRVSIMRNTANGTSELANTTSFKDGEQAINTNSTSSTLAAHTLRITKTGTAVRGSFIRTGTAYTNVGNAVTFDEAFFKNAKLQLFATNSTESVDLSASYTVTLDAPATVSPPASVGDDQLAVEKAGELIGNIITVDVDASASPEEKAAKAEQALSNNARLAELGVSPKVSVQGSAFALTLTKGLAGMTVSPFEVAAAAFSVSAVKTLVENCAANVAVKVTGPDTAGLKAALFGKTAELQNGSATLKFKAAEIKPAGDYIIEILRGSAVIATAPISVVALPAGIWAPAAAVTDGKTVVRFGADISFLAAKKSVTVDSAIIADEKLTVSGKDLIIDADASGKKVVISGVKYAALFPSYNFTFTITVEDAPVPQTFFPITFEDGSMGGFTSRGGAALSIADVTGHDNKPGKALFVGSERQTWGGTQINATRYLTPGAEYEFVAYVRSTGATSSQFILTAQISAPGQDTQYVWLNDREISEGDGWVRFSGSHLFEEGQTMTIYVENSGLNAYYLDDFSILLDGKPVA